MSQGACCGGQTACSVTCTSFAPFRSFWDWYPIGWQFIEATRRIEPPSAQETETKESTPQQPMSEERNEERDSPMTTEPDKDVEALYLTVRDFMDSAYIALPKHDQ